MTESARIISVNVGLPREIAWRGKVVRTSIFKTPVAGRVRVTALNLEGDRQSDLSVHGGAYKAVYAYPSEHYTFWRDELAHDELPWGAFGENLTLQGLLEEHVRIGDRLTIGTAEFTVTQPRMPCFKLGLRHQRPDLVKRFERAARPGFYLAVAAEGELGAGDAVTLIPDDPAALSVKEIARLRTARRPDRDSLERAASLAGLAPSWRAHFERQLTDDDSP